jgi:hypothetical protein
MTARQVDALLDERARLVTRNAAIEGHLWASELLLKRCDKLLAEAILPSAAMAATRDVLREEIAELLTEDRNHGAPNVPVTSERGEALGGDGEA